MPVRKSAHVSAVDAFVGLGSNLGDRAASLAFAARALSRHPHLEWVASSRVFETDPIGPGDQGPYLNAVLWLRARVRARELLAHLLELEALAGRRRSEEVRWGPRCLDLDLLLFGDQCIEEPGLRVPHPRLHERAFVLVPLCELAAERRHPSRANSFGELELALRSPVAGGGPAEFSGSGIAVWGGAELLTPLGASP
jgi:2-amino-4-hydroxy-6-hydroxymethyldihydropteridine diphosphokinase